jgi:hypothetical protein
MSELWLPGDAIKPPSDLQKPSGTVEVDPDRVTVHVVPARGKPALCGFQHNAPPAAWPVGHLYVTLAGKIYLANCPRCRRRANSEVDPKERR